MATAVDHIDMAQYYGPGVVNDLIREALNPYPDGLAIVSKIAVRRDELGAVLPFGIAPLEAREHDPPGTACPPGGPGHTRGAVHRAESAYYLTARTLTGRMSGSRASRSADTSASAAGIWPLMCAVRASPVAKVSKMP
jgi:hypothetical protein